MELDLFGEVDIDGFYSGIMYTFFRSSSVGPTNQDGNTIHSKVQLEHMGLVVHDTPAAHGGYQMVITFWRCI